MIDGAILKMWLMRFVLIGLAVIVVFFHLLPLFPCMLGGSRPLSSRCISGCSLCLVNGVPFIPVLGEGQRPLANCIRGIHSDDTLNVVEVDEVNRLVPDDFPLLVQGCVECRGVLCLFKLLCAQMLLGQPAT